VTRELSTAWWNVVRRKMRATAAKAYPVKCPDCGSSTHLMEGKFGRFYKCCRFDCSGTHGARLDGKPVKPKGPRDLVRARVRAREAVQRVVAERDRIERETVQWKRAFGCGPWWNHDHTFANCKDDFRTIVFAAKLPPVTLRRRPGSREWRPFWAPVGLYLRKRSVEECERVIKAAEEHIRTTLAEADAQIRRKRGHAWDRVLVGTLGEDPTIAPPEPELGPPEIDLGDGVTYSWA
jgi:hypothetical protein